MKKAEIVTGAGMDLLSAPDKTPGGRMVDLLNMDPDSLGALHSRDGFQEVSSGLGEVKCIYRSGENRYVVDSGSLRYGYDSSSVIFVGLDQNPTRIASYAGFSWLMNRSAQLRLENSRVANMGIRAPGSAPRAVVGSPSGALLDDFELGGTRWDVYLVTGNLRKTPERRAIYYDAGTVSISDGSKTITGTGTNWDSSFKLLFMRIYAPDGQSVLYDVVLENVTGPTAAEAVTEMKHTLSGLKYEIYDWVDVFQYDTSNKLSGTSSFRVDLNPPGTWSIQATFDTPRDLTIGGKALDTDFMRLRFYADKPSAIEQLSVILIDSERRYALAIVDGSLLNQALFSWNYLRIPRAMDEKAILGANPEFWKLSEARTQAIEAGDAAKAENIARQMASLYNRAMALTPSFSARMGIEELGQTLSFDWSRIVEARFSIIARDACTVHFDRAEFIGGEAAPLEGVYRYWVTFENALGHESAPSPASQEVKVSNEPVTLENVVVSQDPQVVRRRIYRSGGTLIRPVRVGTIWNNYETTFQDKTSDREAQTENIEPPWDADPPPAASGIAGPFFGRMVAWGVAQHPARLYWSETAKPWSWPGSRDGFEGNWVDVGGDDDPIMAVTVQSNTLRIYKARSIWRIAGDPDSADPEPVVQGIGAAGPYAVAQAIGVDYFASLDGVYRFTGDVAHPVSLRIDPLFRGRWVQPHPGIPAVPPLRREAFQNLYLAYSGRTLFVCGQDELSRGVLLVYREDKDEWYRFSLPGFAVPTAASYEGFGAAPAWLVAGGGKIWALRSHLEADIGGSMPIYVQALLYPGTDSGAQASWQEVSFDFKGGPVVAKALFSDGSVVDLGVLNSASRTTLPLRIPQTGGKMSPLAGIRLEGDITRRFSLFAFYLFFLVEPSLSQQFDSGPLPLPTDSMIEQVEIAYRGNPGPLVKIYTDLPGGDFAERASFSLEGAASRRQVRRDVAVDARSFRVFLEAQGAPFQVYSLRVKIRPYAVYLNPGESWSSGAF